jgi:hypothetical protein
MGPSVITIYVCRFDVRSFVERRMGLPRSV